jgi:hypothetical protein
MNQPPPGHNPDVSMLSGGTEPVVGVMGGGTRTGRAKSPRAKRAKSSRAKRAKKSVMKGGDNVIKIEHLKPHKIDLRLNEPIVKVPDADAANIVQNYVTKQTALWKRQAAGTIVDASKIITNASCAATSYDETKGDKGQSGFDRLGCILPENIEGIIVIPPIHGNYLTYTAAINTLTSTNSLADPSAVILFSPPLFSGKDIPGNPAAHPIVNRDIFLHFLNMKATAQATIYYLAEYTQNSIYTGCRFTSTTTQSYVVPLLEPSYVLYPYIRKMDNKTYSGLLFSAAGSDEVILPAPTSSSKLGLIAAAQRVNDMNGAFVAFPPSSKQDPLLNKSSIPYRQYRFLANYSNAAYLLDSTDIAINMFTLKEGYVASIAPTYNEGDKFKPSKDAFLTGVTYSNIPLGPKQYSLRHPRTLEVVNDWKNLIFTQPEVDFLNDLNLRPDILNELYAEKYKGKSWSSDLATNLTTIVRSKCFSDNRLVLHSSCQASQKFITDVLEFFVEHDSRIKALEQNEMEAENNRLKLTLDSKLSAAAKAAATGMDKDPIADKLVFRTGQAYGSRYNINYTPIEEIKSKVYSRTVIIYNVTAKTHDVVKLVCSAPECTNMDDATRYLETKYQLLNTEYPNYTVAP